MGFTFNRKFQNAQGLYLIIFLRTYVYALFAGIVDVAAIRTHCSRYTHPLPFPVRQEVTLLAALYTLHLRIS